MNDYCACCAMIRENGRPRPPRLATYWWTGPNGWPVAVCEDCAACWLLNALDDDWMMPHRVDLVRP